MKRLTYEAENCYMLQECDKFCSRNCGICKVAKNAINCLADYENTKLTPEEIKRVIKVRDMLREENAELKCRLKEFIKLQTENKNLQYTILGIMQSVDKWLDNEELKLDEVNRAMIMREKTLKIIEQLQAENATLKARLEKAMELPCELGSVLLDYSEFFDGDTSPDYYLINAKEITISKDDDGEIIFTIDSNYYYKSDFGKIIFPNTEEAEKALKEKQ